MHPLAKTDRRGGQVSIAITPDQRAKTRRQQGRTTKAAKNGETSNKEKAAAVFMVQPWQRVTRQRVTQIFLASQEISFPPLANNDGQETPMVIEAEVEGHLIHRMYVDGGSVSEVLYEHCFNRLCSKVKSQMILATTLLLGFSGEISSLLGQISLMVSLGEEYLRKGCVLHHWVHDVVFNNRIHLCENR
ncbi:hypothetical protein Tco_1333503 [Tanacetum coccineum]